MDKIICDVCGTSYPESAEHCPICGNARSAGAKSAPAEDTGHSSVRGGRFSNNNVKRRTTDNASVPSAQTQKKKSAIKGSNLILGIVAIVLAVVVITLIVVFVSNIVNNVGSSDEEQKLNTNTVQTQPPVEKSPCRELHTSTPQITLAQKGDQTMLNISTVPEAVLEAVTYFSMDPKIASVNEYGAVTAVSGGTTNLIIRCGEANLIVSVNCDFAPDIPADATWSMNRKDITLTKKGETWDLYSKSSSIARNLIKWTSDDESVAKINDGVVEAVSGGTTKVRGECNGISYTCMIRCNLPKGATEEDKKPDAENATDSSEATEPTDETKTTEEEKTVSISHVDVTLRPEGEANEQSFTLILKDPDGNKLDVTWKASEEGYVTIDGNKITAVKAGKTITVSTTYENKEYKCVIRLK